MLVLVFQISKGVNGYGSVNGYWGGGWVNGY